MPGIERRVALLVQTTKPHRGCLYVFIIRGTLDMLASDTGVHQDLSEELHWSRGERKADLLQYM